ncbi:MAG: class I SAM-dependent methyltransferase [Anaerolineae bacterium]|nr:class I SAM-dependent methyltransferase [Anaerolineae bacterium]
MSSSPTPPPIRGGSPIPPPIRRGEPCVRPLSDPRPRGGVRPAQAEAADDRERGALLGRPSYVWGFGQERRFALVRPYLVTRPSPMLDVGCGVGVYMERFRQEGVQAFGVDVEATHLPSAARKGLPVAAARAEHLPFGDAAFGTVLLHEVIEHFSDDAVCLAEAMRVTRPGGRVFIFAPNRLYPFETHGIYWRGRYIQGNIPLVGYLPNPMRRRLAPHVRAYTVWELRRLLASLPCRVVAHVQIYPGYDKIFRRWPAAARLARGLTYLLERTPLRAFGLSHFVVVERMP